MPEVQGGEHGGLLDEVLPPPEPAGGPSDVPPDRRGGRRLRQVMVVLLVLVGVIAAGGFYAAHRLQVSYDRNIERFGDPFKDLPARPVVQSHDAMNILLVGSDSRISAGDPTRWTAGAQRTDAIMMVHVPEDRSGAYVVSIPRDSWVPVPGHGRNKVNAAFSFGGPSLMVRTVEELTSVRIDHVVIVDFDGFQQITDALGGVTIEVPRTTHDERGTFTAGTHRMDGATALRYVRQRHNLPGGDFDRVRRQQNWMRAVLGQTVSRGTLSNPLKVNDVLQALTRSLATDDAFSIGEMRELALSLRSVRSRDVAFLTAPVHGTGRSADGQSIVLLDRPAGAALWKAMAKDRMAAWVADHRDALTGSTVR